MALAEQVPRLRHVLLQQLASTTCPGGMRDGGTPCHRHATEVVCGACQRVLPVAAESANEPRRGDSALDFAQDVSLRTEGRGEVRRLPHRVDQQEVPHGLSEHGTW